jgi:AraC family ethanolamine operon transcriptional activator
MAASEPGRRPERCPASTGVPCAEVIVTNDPDECAVRMRAMGMSVRHNQMSSGPYSADVATVQFPGVRVSLTSYGSAITSHGTPPRRSYALALPLAPTPGTFFNHRPLGRNEIGLVRPGEEFQILRPTDFRCVMVFPDANTIDRRAEALFGRTFAQIVGGGRALMSNDRAIASCAERLAAICRDWTRAPDPGGNAPAPAASAQVLGPAILDEVLGIVQPPEPIHGWSARERIVHRAWELVEADAEGCVTVADLCLKLAVPIRSLDEAFQSCLGMTPKRFILGLRLNNVRSRLSHPHDDTTVSEAATHFGFFHFGHFAGQYRRLFGEAPSQTLRRART